MTIEPTQAQIERLASAAETNAGPVIMINLVVEYPSRRAFLDMISNPRYLGIHAHRAAALADSRLIACTPV